MLPFIAGLVVLVAPTPYTVWTENAKVPPPPEGIVIYHDAAQVCSGGRACVKFDGTLHIHPDPDEWNSGRARHATFEHEVGHVFDLQTNLEDEFLAIDGRSVYTQAVAETFADAYRICAFHQTPLRADLQELPIYSDWRDVTAAQAQAACELIR